MEFRPLSFEEYRLLAEQAPIMIWRSGPDKLCDYFNERWLEFTGRTMRQELGNGWTEGVHVDDFDRCLEIYVGSFDQRTSFEMEYRLRRHDGEYRWIFDRGVPFYLGDELFGGYIGSCIDVTARVEAEMELEKRRNEEIDELRKLLPICSSCKKVRDDSGYWQEVEGYIRRVSNIELTHGLCPDCVRNIYGEYVDDEDTG
ncbi:MAG: hypothetical protein Kow00129_09260 [Thermoleophilia bacterium]